MAKRNSKDSNKKIKVIQQELGRSGTALLRGFLREDYSSTLRWPQSINVYEKMIKGDAQVKASVKVCQLPITSAKWYIEGKDQDEDLPLQEASEFINDALFNHINFEDFLPQALGMLPYGYAIFEKVFKVEEGKIYWDKFAWRKQSTVYRWETQDGEEGITQNLSDSGGGMVSIPAWKLMNFIYDKEGDNHAGVSILRSAYKHWYMKDTFYKIDAIAFERNGIGVLKITLPSGHDNNDITKAEELGENFYANEQQYIILPNDEWQCELLDGASSLRDPKDSIGHHNREITKNVLAQFLELGTGEGGSKALSQDHSGLFYLSLEAIAKIIISVMNEAIKELCDMNGFVLETYPQLAFSHIGNMDYMALSSALQSLSGAGIIKPDMPLEAHVRNLMQLPERDETEEDIEVEQPKEEVVEKVIEEEKKEEKKDNKYSEIVDNEMYDLVFNNKMNV